MESYILLALLHVLLNASHFLNALSSQQNKVENGKIKEINRTDWP